MKALLHSLVRSRQTGLVPYCLAIAALAAAGSVALSIFLEGLSSVMGTPVFPLHGEGIDLLSRPNPILVTVFASLLEASVTASLLGVFSRRVSSPLATAALFALPWAGLNAVMGAAPFPEAYWLCFVFSCSFLAWQRNSPSHGFVAMAIPIALVNLGGLALEAFSLSA